MSKAPKLTLEQELALALVRLRKLESELDNAKDLYLHLAARTLRLELAVSAMAPDDMIREILHPGEGANV